MNERGLSFLPFELAYLALLTKCELKRLSRWEHALPEDQTSVLRDFGLKVMPIQRRTLLGRTTHETVFSRTTKAVDLYASRFDGRRLSSSREDVRMQGFLFGYPSCCVEEFIRHPYSKNNLDPQDQRILFHWACLGCKVTPSLLRDYRIIHRACLDMFGGVEPAGRRSRLKSRSETLPAVLRALQRGALPAACLSALLLLPKAAGSSDPHLIPVADDEDSDYVSFAEEILRGVDWHNPSTAPDTLLDGVALAHHIRSLIDSLPDSVQTDAPYKTYEFQYGTETCEVCSLEVNMGCIHIVHPLRGLAAEVPFIAYHYLQHGSLSYLGSVHDGRVDFSQVKRILFCADSTHHIFYDSWDDNDGLKPEEEYFIGTSDTIPDTDGDSVKDGPQYLEGVVASLTNISREVSDTEPYMIEMQQDGVETCSICGNTYNMGFVQLVNPMEDLTADIPYVALHYLAHGCPSYDGSINDGRLLPILINTVINGDGTSHWLEVEGDTDGDGLTDDEEAYFALDPNNCDTDGDGTPDGPALAQAMYDIIDGLPREASADSVYRLDTLFKGVHCCLICGECVNMGYTDIINPQTGDSLNYLGLINLHFMEHGSFSSDRPYEYGRSDPRQIDQVLGSPSYVIGEPVVRHSLRVFPNPFMHKTRILCQLPQPATLRITIHDVLGRQVLEYRPGRAARYEFFWDGTDGSGRKLPAGVYFVRFDLANTSLSKKVLLLR